MRCVFSAHGQSHLIAIPELVCRTSVSHHAQPRAIPPNFNQSMVGKQALKVHTLDMDRSSFKSPRKSVFLLVIVLVATSILVPANSSASSWRCEMQIPKSGKISSWCGTNPVNIRMSGSRGSGWVGMNPFSLWVSGSRASGWLGTEPISLWKSASRVSGWVGQSPVSCRVSGSNNFCMTFTVTDSN